jgi:transcriptional regulatory protein LEU3
MLQVLIFSGLERVYISCTQLQLQIFYFFDGIQAQKRKEGLMKCYETASTMIQTMISAEVDLSSVLYAPAQAYRTVLVAGIVLLRILNSSYSELVDFKIGKQNFNTAIRMLRQHSLQDNDISGRASKILSQLWIHYQNSPSIRESPPSLQLKSRLGGSLLHDSLWTWRRECDDQKASRRGTRQNCERTLPIVSLPNPMYCANTSSSSTQVNPTRLGRLAQHGTERYNQHRRDE